MPASCPADRPGEDFSSYSAGCSARAIPSCAPCRPSWGTAANTTFLGEGYNREPVPLNGRQSLAVTADVSSSEDVARMVESVVNKFGRIDILVNNAGVTRDGLVMRMSDDDWNTVLNIDLKSAFLC